MKKYLWLLNLLCPFLVSAAIQPQHLRIISQYNAGGAAGPPVFAGTVTTATGGAVSSITISNHTVGSGSNRLLMVGVSMKFGTTAVSSVYWNTTEQLTSLGRAQQEDDAHAELFYLVAPTETTADVVVTLDSELAGEGGIIVAAINFVGANQGGGSSTFGTLASASGSSSGPVTVDVTTATNQVVIDCAAVKFETLTVVSPQTERWNETSAQQDGAGSTKPGDSSPVTMSWTIPGTHQWAIVGVGIKPVS